MKFDITRAWKDEAYRQTLSEEELHLIPANPAGELELTDTELDAVSGGFGGGIGGFGGFGPGGVIVSNHDNSVAVICEINVFSINIVNAAIIGAVNNICTNVN
jgi:mersacidin/lichenicidin family type 2 lantibiotic